MRHLDLFSGIGGFALAVEEIWPDSEHTFCDNDRYCQELLKLRFPNSKIYGDIKEIKSIADADRDGLQKQRKKQQASGNRQLFKNKAEGIFKARFDSDSDSNGFTGRKKKFNPTKAGKQALDESERCVDLITGGFPCQPFSQAGKRRGTDDDRYLWPEMLRVIRFAKPRWVIAENVRGLLTMQNGMVFEQVCSDLENSGYEVQPFIIPAVSVNAPHRRDRIWFVAHALGDKSDRKKKRRKLSETPGEQKQIRTPYGSARQSLRTASGRRSERFEKNAFVAEDARNAESAGQPGGDERQRKTQHGRAGSGSDKRLASDTESKRKGRCSGKKRGIKKRTMEQGKPEGCEIRRESKGRAGHIAHAESGKSRKPSEPKRRKGFKRRSWERSWLEVAAELCGVDDGLPAELDGFELSKSRHRVERLKALGNAIVPQVATEIMRAIKIADEEIGDT
jgi:DNA (cytosine-5)-methyltransferase 1